jgi:NADP-dependent 3-hydroxy acid dehydrogenase YdfG
MTPRTLEFKYVIIAGGGGGLGRAMAEWLISQGKKIIIVGRTESKLQSAAQELGHNTTYYVLDTGNIGTIPTFIK